jgi:cation transport ATPase
VSLEELLALTAALESQSEHPLAGSVLDFAESVIAPSDHSRHSHPAEEVNGSFSKIVMS